MSCLFHSRRQTLGSPKHLDMRMLEYDNSVSFWVFAALGFGMVCEVWHMEVTMIKYAVRHGRLSVCLSAQLPNISAHIATNKLGTPDSLSANHNYHDHVHYNLTDKTISTTFQTLHHFLTSDRGLLDKWDCNHPQPRDFCHCTVLRLALCRHSMQACSCLAQSATCV